jgi:hypothetical protein
MGDWKIGDRVRIAPVKFPLRQPHLEHEGKPGTITGKESITDNGGRHMFYVPVITLDDGTVLRGYECWWEQFLQDKIEKGTT